MAAERIRRKRRQSLTFPPNAHLARRSAPVAAIAPVVIAPEILATYIIAPQIVRALVAAQIGRIAFRGFAAPAAEILIQPCLVASHVCLHGIEPPVIAVEIVREQRGSRQGRRNQHLSDPV
jgi:hypothetical protein